VSLESTLSNLAEFWLKPIGRISTWDRLGWILVEVDLA